MNGPVQSPASNPLRALADATAALKAADTDENKSAFARALLRAGAVSDTPEMRELLARAFAEAWIAPRLLFNAAGLLIRSGPSRPFIERAVWSWPKPVSIEEFSFADPLARLYGDTLLLAVLRATFVSDLALEKFLTTMRAALLDHALKADSSAPPADDLLDFACALAEQCHNNEYVWRTEKDEKTRLEKLHRLLKSPRPLSPLWLAVAAAYDPLNELEFDPEEWPEPVQALIAQQTGEAEKIAEARSTIPQIGEINDKVSQAVREQYEENPYPRWKAVPSRPRAQTLREELRAKFPHSNIGNDSGTFDVLIAGCGTGQQVPEYAAYPHAKVQAVDLSLASLAYAKTKADELRLKNVKFSQADILKLDFKPSSFDLIVSTGVLHHMDDPEKGWRKLVSLLKPGGLMHIALYSELARRSIVAAREVIAAKNYRATASAIRKFRQDVISGGLPALKPVLAAPDFYSLSECRDLLFHVHEQRFTLPRIAAFLAENGLAFIGFESTVRTGPQFSATFSQPGHFGDLTRWHEYEQKNPDAFAGMYNFWVRKQEV